MLANDGLSYIVQLTSVVPGATYYVQTTQQPPSGQQTPADYHLSIAFGAQGSAAAPAVAAPAVARNTLSQTNQTDAGTLNLAQAGLVHFALSADEGNSTVPVNVTMTVTDSTGKTVFTLTAQGGKPPITLNYYLGAGTYQVTYKVSLGSGAPGGATIPSVTFELDAGIFSQPQGPYFTGSTTSSSSGGLSYSGTVKSGSTPYYY